MQTPPLVSSPKTGTIAPPSQLNRRREERSREQKRNRFPLRLLPRVAGRTGDLALEKTSIMSTSTTPRTDAAINTRWVSVHKNGIVDADFARSLERELIARDEALEVAETALEATRVQMLSLGWSRMGNSTNAHQLRNYRAHELTVKALARLSARGLSSQSVSSLTVAHTEGMKEKKL